MRVGVIGTGFGARVVAPVFAATRGCEVVDVVSARDTDAIERLCRRADVDLVSVHSPPFRHAADVRLALDAGHLVLCDKPFCAAELVAQAEATGVVHAVNFEFRHDPARLRLRQLLADGAIGVLQQFAWTHASDAWRRRASGWQFDRALGGGWIGAWASHAVDTVRWLFGEIDGVVGVPRNTLQRGDAEDGITAVLRTVSGVDCVLDGTGAAAAGLAVRVVVSGSDGVLECVADSRLTLRRADGSREDIAVERGDGDPHLAGMQRWAEALRDAVHDGAPVPPTFADGAACDVVLDRLRRAGRN